MESMRWRWRGDDLASPCADHSPTRSARPYEGVGAGAEHEVEYTSEVTPYEKQHPVRRPVADRLDRNERPLSTNFRSVTRHSGAQGFTRALLQLRASQEGRLRN